MCMAASDLLWRYAIHDSAHWEANVCSALLLDFFQSALLQGYDISGTRFAVPGTAPSAPARTLGPIRLSLP